MGGVCIYPMDTSAMPRNTVSQSILSQTQALQRILGIPSGYPSLKALEENSQLMAFLQVTSLLKTLRFQWVTLAPTIVLPQVILAMSFTLPVWGLDAIVTTSKALLMM